MSYEPVITAQPETAEVKIDSTQERNPIDFEIAKDEITEEKPLMLLGGPFVTKIYGFEEEYKDDIGGLKEKMDLIDTYLKTQILQDKWKPTVENYKKKLAEFEERLNLGEEMTEYDRVELMYYYLKGKYKL